MTPRSPTPPTLLQKMLDYLKDKKEVGFFQSIQALMQTCRWALVHILFKKIMLSIYLWLGWVFVVAQVFL